MYIHICIYIYIYQTLARYPRQVGTGTEHRAEIFRDHAQRRDPELLWGDEQDRLDLMFLGPQKTTKA